MKKTDLEKSKALKIVGQMKQGPTPNRFAGIAQPDRRDQRRLDQAQGLVPFPVKLPQALVEALRVRALAEEKPTNALIADLLEQALAA